MNEIAESPVIKPSPIGAIGIVAKNHQPPGNLS
jgi:hypothetical protein